MAEAWDRICPPIGLRAPPATNVMVAPGSAVSRVSQRLHNAHSNDTDIVLG